jgi:hypothetical protein
VKQNILQYQKLQEEIKVNNLQLLLPKAYDIAFKPKRQVFWLSPIGSSLPIRQPANSG